MESRSHELNVRCLEIIEELVQKHRQWVSFELLLSVLLDRYSVSRFEELGVGGIEDILCLLLVHNLNHKLNLFLYAYCNKNIVALRDLERDACAMLKTFHYPTVDRVKEQNNGGRDAQRQADPNEIGLDEEEEESVPDLKEVASTPADVTSVGNYGLGELQMHPFVASMFPYTLDSGTMKGTADVMSGLSRYLTVRAHTDSSSSLDVSKFACYVVEEQWGGGSGLAPERFGVVIKGIGPEEVLACRQVDEGAHVESVLSSESKAAETVIGTVRSKRLAQQQVNKQRSGEGAAGQEQEQEQGLEQDQEDDSSQPKSKKRARDTDTSKEGVVDVNLAMPTSRFTEVIEVPTSELQHLCFQEDWGDTRTGTGGAMSADALKEVGRWGEALVYQYLRSQTGPRKVVWVNQEEESKAAYDLILEEAGLSSSGRRTQTTFVEVKTTRFPDRNVFDLSLNEWAFASAEPALRYDVYRVYNAGDPTTVRISIVRDLYGKIKDQQVRLCLVV
jgi:hypothetical protein